MAKDASASTSLAEPVNVTDSIESIAMRYVRFLDSSPDGFPIVYPRASDLYKGCIRMYVLGSHLRFKKSSFTNAGSRLTFMIGEAVHKEIQNTTFVFGNKRIGWWKCRACKSCFFGLPPNTNCLSCGAHFEAFEYKEHSMFLTSPVYLSGHPDLFLLLDDGTVVVIEIKTIAKKYFDKLISPQVEHEWQVLSYMWGLNQDSSMPIPIRSDIGFVLYVCKTHVSSGMPMKMFPVNGKSKVIGRIVEKLEVFKLAYDSYPKGLPDIHPLCQRSNFSSWQTRNCPCYKQCMEFYHAQV